MDRRDDVMIELEEMKGQIALLKSKLEEQEIVREQHMRRAIKGNLQDLNRVAVRMMLVGVFAIFFCTSVFVHYGFSFYFAAFTFLILMFSTVATYVQHKNLLKSKDLSCDLVKESYDLVKLKKRYGEWLYFAVPMVAVWFSWLVYETLNYIPDRAMGIGFVVGSGIGGAIGGLVGLKIHFKTVKKIDEMLSQIKELEEQ